MAELKPVTITFRNEQQERFYNCTLRNHCFSGGFNNGKTFAACLKAATLLLTFSNYRVVIARQRYTDLKNTTLQTFFKIVPPELIAKFDTQNGVLELKNGSIVYWMHLDKVDEQRLRGLEINSVVIDQAEEIDEQVYLVLDSRIGRWDRAEVPEWLQAQYKEQNGRDWPLTALGLPKAPTYMMPLCNPDSQFHWLYRYYHPDSLERRPDHLMIQGETDPNLGDPETIKQMLSRDPEWVAKYFRGEWGASSAQIHYVPSACLLDPTDELIEKIRVKANLYRALDHGDSSPTCCLWFAAIDGVFICYREYYSPGQLISYHRSAIQDLSGEERYSGNYADPSIFHVEGQKNGGFWSVADEYLTNDIKAPALHWQPADNNEFATRNRINELLANSELVKHPITDASPAPRLYFVRKSENYPHGCFHAITQLQSQRRKLLGYDNGKAIYIDDRDEKVTDHAYDPLRYFVAAHGLPRKEERPKPPRNSFKWFKMQMQMKQMRAAVPASVA